MLTYFRDATLDRVAGNESIAKSDRSEFKERTKTARVKDFLTLVTEIKGLVVLGDPGSGKTTCLLQLGVELANRAALSRTLYPLLPVYLPLNEFTDPLPANKASEAVYKFVKQQIRQQAAPLEGADISSRLDTLIGGGRVAFLFDSLDEMPRDGYYDRFRALSRFVKSCQAQSEGNLFVFTCRKLDYIDDPTFPVQQVALSPFSDRQIQDFFARYLPRTGALSYHDFVSKHADLALQARSPFFLSLLTTCVQAGVEPGGTWNVLIANFVQVVFDNYRRNHGLDKAEWEPVGQELSNLALRLRFRTGSQSRNWHEG